MEQQQGLRGAGKGKGRRGHKSLWRYFGGRENRLRERERRKRGMSGGDPNET